MVSTQQSMKVQTNAPEIVPGKADHRHESEPVLPRVVSGAEAVILSLLEEGVDTIFGYPGGAIMPIYDALFDYPDQIRHILVRHEQGATHAAEGYARACGRPGVVFATSGPGATNLITGITDALMDSTPMVCITGQVTSVLLGTDAFQETDVMGITMPVTKWNFQVTKPEEIAPAIAKAFYLACSGRPGPVLVDITKDAQFAKTAFTYEKCRNVRSYVPKPRLQPAQVAAAAALINKARKPYILAGHGVLLAGATEQLKAFAEKAQIPVACTLLGLGAFPPDHPLYAGYLGMHGNYGPNILTNSCDVLIAVGMRFDDRVTGKVSEYARQAKVVHIEIDPSEINRTIETEAPVLGDAREALAALTTLVHEAEHDAWIQEFQQYAQMEFDKVIEKAVHRTEGPLYMPEVIYEMSRQSKGEAIVVTDVGQHQMMVSRYYQFKRPDSIITSGGLGTMGFGLPAAIGAKLACPDRQVVVVAGDGGYQMTIQELGVLLQEEIPVKILLLNNNYLGMVRQWQQLFFDNRYSFTELKNPDFVAIARAYGIAARKITEREDLGMALKEMLAHPGAYFLEVEVEKEENVFPMVPAGAGVADIRLE
jgi:acetolactate synthase-1/2/3 large subunit